ncbi:MAG: amidohydrolase [Desulfomonilaceae bacterium]|nr:amidohydrolase [Desulfomonilaceae bacterium]
MNLIPEITALHREMIQWRHDLHMHPELYNQEIRTAAKVAELLESFGVDEVVRNVGTTGVLGVLRNGDGPVVGLRADMDALAVADAGEHDHQSLHEGVTHACGHDGHMAMLLGAAKYLAQSRNFRGTVVFVFQPAEEMASGASCMLADGFLRRYGIESVYALHAYPGLPIGSISITPGTALASVNNFSIEITGQGGHAGVPHHARDPISAGAAIVMGLQSIVTQRVDPLDGVVISVTSFRSGSDTYNVIPESVRLRGTLRYLNPEYEKDLPAMVQELVEGLAAGHGVTASFEYVKGCPPLVNPENECRFAMQVAEELVGPANVIQGSPIMGGEDFAFYLAEIPGVFAFIGNGEDSYPLHHAAFDFNDDALPVGASCLSRIVERALQRG